MQATDQDGWTALHYGACDTNNPGMIYAIVEAPHGLDVLNARDDYGFTPLLIAAEFNRPRSIEALISFETINVKIKTRNEKTALEWATEGGNEDCVRLLNDYNKRLTVATK